MLAVLKRTLPEIPFLLIGRSARLEHVLRQAGLPVVVYRRGSKLSKAKNSIPTQFAFFDTRNVSSQTAVSWAGQANEFHMTHVAV